MRAFNRWAQILLAASLIVVIGAFSASGLTISSTVQQIGGLTQQLTPYKITADASPYDFSGQDFALLNTIAGIFVTLTMTDGDSAPGDFDFGDLTLGLDGFDTGIELNEFGDGETVTRTILGAPGGAAAILDALQMDGMLAGTVIDKDGAPVGPSNEITFPATFNTTLVISDEPLQPIPEPATLVLLGSGLAGLVGVARRQKRQGGAHRRPPRRKNLP